MSELALKAIDDCIEYSVAKFGKDKAFPDNIENIVLSRLYTYGATKPDDNYSWHVYTSEIHDKDQAHLHTLFTNHEILLSHADNVKDPATGLLTLAFAETNLRYYAKTVSNFKVNGAEKRLCITIINQTYDPPSSL